MHLKTRNVNTAFRELVGMIHRHGEGDPDNFFSLSKRPPARKDALGGTLTIDEAMTLTYERPMERVLFNAARDANPFFHLYESLWMLAGRNDVAAPAYYARQIGEYSDDGTTLNGAYGYRWRRASLRPDAGWEQNPIDQLDVIVKHLKANPDSRRAVLSMWNVDDDLLKIGGAPGERGPIWHQHARKDGAHKFGLSQFGEGGYEVERVDVNGVERFNVYPLGHGAGSKDVCCNLSATVQLRKTGATTGGFVPGGIEAGVTYALDLTVFNRSNYLFWGTLGANAVHFSFLQEYLAARLSGDGLHVHPGVYNQVSSNLHVYEGKNWNPAEWTEWEGSAEGQMFARFYDEHTTRFPLVKDPATFEAELPLFVQRHASGDAAMEPRPERWTEPFFEHVAEPMLQAFHAYKRRGAPPMMWVGQIHPADWRVASFNWLNDRLVRRVAKEATNG